MPGTRPRGIPVAFPWHFDPVAFYIRAFVHMAFDKLKMNEAKFDDLVRSLGSKRTADALMEGLLQLQASKDNHWQMNKARWDIVYNSFMPVIL